jgi:hypothetical protein
MMAVAVSWAPIILCTYLMILGCMSYLLDDMAMFRQTEPSHLDMMTSIVFELHTNNINHVQTFDLVGATYSSSGNDVYSASFVKFRLGEFNINDICPSESSCLIYYPAKRKDRSCLVAPPTMPSRERERFMGDLDSVSDLERFVSTRIGFSLEKLFQLKSLSHFKITAQSRSCDEVDYKNLNMGTFLSTYWVRQRPVVIKNFFSPPSHPALSDILRKHGHARVGAKLSPTTDFEGIDDLLNWEMAKSQYVPREILNQMESPHLVVVRAAHVEMTLNGVLDGISEGISETAGRANEISTNRTNIYVEYMPIKDDLLASLYAKVTNLNAHDGGSSSNSSSSEREDISSYHQFMPDNGPSVKDSSHTDRAINALTQHAPFVQYMQDGNAYLWLGDGHTLGKLHFDPFDNIMLQVSFVRILINLRTCAVIITISIIIIVGMIIVLFITLYLVSNCLPHV